jgi:parallel beta-helix repeat protein
MQKSGLVAALLFLAIAVFDTRSEAANVPGDFSSIQGAINAIVNGSLPDGTVVNIQPGTYGETLLIGATPRSMTLRAAGGAGTVVVDGGGKGSTLQILSASGNVRIEGLKLRNGRGDLARGGGLTIDNSSPTVVNCTVESNSSSGNGGGVMLSGRSNAVFDGCVVQNNTAAQFGGGIFIGGGSRPTFSNCTIQGNASGTTSNIGSGGGLNIQDASATILGSHIVSNRAAFAGGGILAIAPFGSAFGESTLTIEDSDVSNNTAARFSASDPPTEGGAIHLEDNMAAVIKRSTIRNNTANTGGGLNAYRARYSIEASIIDGNTAQDPAGIGGFGGGLGASSSNVGMPVQRAASLTLTNTVIRNNNSRLGGGFFVSGDQLCGGGTCTNNTANKATLQIVASVIDQNAATIAGGVFVTRTNLTMTDGLVSRNQATGGTGGLGGGVLVTTSAATLTNMRIGGNSATGVGGGLFVDGSAILTASGLAVHNNSAPAAAGGGIFVGRGGNSGSVRDSAFVDNSGLDIADDCPPPSSAPYMTYTNVKFGTTDVVYAGGCNPPGTLTAAAFGRLPNVSGAGTIGLADVQARALFIAVPSSSPSVLAWSVIRATSVSISPTVGRITTNPQVGTADVSVTATTTYTLTASTSLGSLNPPLTATVSGAPVRFGAPGDVPVPADYDGDGKTDLAVYRPATGEWFIFGSSTGFYTRVFGAPASTGLGDIPVPADFDGDGKADLAIYRQATGEWFVFGTSTGFRTLLFGAPASLGFGDIPVPADFDGDRKADLAVYRQATGEWFVFGTSTGFRTLLFGAPASLGFGDVPVPADYDGDRKADLAVYRRATGEWFVFGTSTGFRTLLFGSPASLGLGDVPVPADYDGDGKADLAVRRGTTGTWFIFRSSLGFLQQVWGTLSDVPAPGDFDGSHKADIAVWRPSDGAWLILP